MIEIIYKKKKRESLTIAAALLIKVLQFQSALLILEEE